LLGEGVDDLRRIAVDEDDPSSGLGRLVLTLVKLLHEVLEKQAIRRMEDGGLTADEVERLGRALKGQAEEIERLREEFSLGEGDLDLPLGTVQSLGDDLG
jgi:hypothetical protein